MANRPVPKQQIVRHETQPHKQPLATSKDIPDYLRPKGMPLGGEDLNQSDVVIPRLALCQSMTPQRKRSDPKYIPGLEEGMFFNTVSGKIYGNKVRLVAAFFYRTRIRFNPLDEGGGIRCQAQDGNHGTGDPGGDCNRCALKEWTNGKKGERIAPECTEFRNFGSVITPDKGLPSVEDSIVFSCKSTATAAAKAINSLWRLSKMNRYSLIYEISSVEQKNDAGTFFVPVVTFSDKRTDCSAREPLPASWASPEMNEIGREIFLGMASLKAQGKLRIDVEEDAREPGTDKAESFDVEEIEREEETAS